MSKKKEVLKHYASVIELSHKIYEMTEDEAPNINLKPIASLAKAIETEANAWLQLDKEILEGSEFDDLGPTE